MYLTIEVAGAKRAEFDLLRWGQRGLDLSTPLEQIGLAAQGQIKQQFTTQGGFRSGGWKPLSQRQRDYKRWRRDHDLDGDPRILFMTNALYTSLTVRNGKGNVFRVNKSSVKVGSRLPYSRVHNLGGGRIPRRPYIEFTHADQSEQARVILRHIFGRS